MTLGGWFQIALNLLKLVNWIIRKYDQETWKRAGYAQAMTEQASLINISVGNAEEALAKAKTMTEEELDSRLGDKT